MIVSRQIWLVLVASGVVMVPAADASAQDAGDATGAGCAASGYLLESRAEVSVLRAELSGQAVQLVDGVPLERVDTWVVPDGAVPVVAIDSDEPLSDGDVWLTLAGQTFRVAPDGIMRAQDRTVTYVVLSHLGPTVRTLGLTLAGSPCDISVTLTADRPGWSTLAGGAGAGLAGLCGLLLVLVARWRTGGWMRRFLFAAPVGLVAGLCYAVAGYENGVRGPFEPFPWWWPATGLALAGLLPLTRIGRRRRRAGEAPTVWLPPAYAAPGSWRWVGGFARSGRTETHRAAAADGTGSALVKLAAAGHAGDPGVRLRLEREARILSDLAHPNLVKLREAVAGAGAPTLVFEDVDGAPLSTGLPGPHAVAVMLEVLAGLAAIHKQGLVHRDVRPENIWLDRAGRVLLANFEAAGPGVEHPVNPEPGTYPSPEQRAGQVLDARSDLYSCAAMLQQVLPAPVPEPVAQLLRRALAEDRGARPPSAEQFAADLRQAAEAGYGPDWTGRGALAAALTAHLAIAAAVIGYGFGSTPAPAGVAGPGAAAVPPSAGLGAAPTEAAAAPGQGVAAAAADPAVAAAPDVSATPGVPATAGTPAAGTAAGGTAGSSGKVAALVNTGVAVVAGAAVAVGVVLVDADPAEAQHPVITPERAQVIFVRTAAEGLATDYDFFAQEAENSFGRLVEVDESVPGGDLVEIAVGVPPGQYEYPAYFLASAQLPYAGGVVSMFARFDRSAAGDPWLMTTFVWSSEELLAPPALDDDGWLVPVPTTAEPALSPQELTDEYFGWSFELLDEGFYETTTPDPREAEDDMFVWLPQGDSYVEKLLGIKLSTIEQWARPATMREPDGGWHIHLYWWLVQEDMSCDGDADDPALLTDVSVTGLADGTALVTLVMSQRWVITNIDTPMECENTDSGSCRDNPAFVFDGVAYRRFGTDHQIRLYAWVPLVSAAEPTEPALTPTPTPTPRLSPETDDGDEDDDEDAGEGDLTVLWSDPMISVEFPSELSVPC